MKTTARNQFAGAVRSLDIGPVSADAVMVAARAEGSSEARG